MQKRVKFAIEDKNWSLFHETFETKQRAKFAEEVTKLSPIHAAVWVKK